MSAVQATLDLLKQNRSSDKTLKLENTEKRDALVAIERKYQTIWQDDGIFQQDAPSTSEVQFRSESASELRSDSPKFFGTMAYPYMNGTLHAGHTFTASKVDFMTGYARMQGKRALFPLGFHCTGMPIKACADKLVREVEMFGSLFERCTEQDITESTHSGATPAPLQDQTREDITKYSTKKSKAGAKAIKLRFQFQIMLALGIPLDEIHLFADPQHWLQYFPPLCKRDLNSLGARIDWRRSFVTTDANPYYDSFVRWQMNRLKELSKIRFGKRYTVYSPKDGQACMDHDRSVGEGVGVQEYTALKLRVKEWSNAANTILNGKLVAGANVYFIPATLRPETMYGQTCCFVSPVLSYGIFKVSHSQYYFLTERAARNAAFQGIFAEWGAYPKVAELNGSDVIGTLVDAPLSVHEAGIRILPMENIKAMKGTGVVTSVPSDSPDDYAMVMELTKKAEYYGIQREWADVEITPIIETPSYGNLAAPYLVKHLKINSPKDVKQLAEAKELAYKEGHYKGVLIYGEFKGKPVEEAKVLVRQKLIASGDAFRYAEPDGLVISRSGDECVAAHLDQWYLNYGKNENGGDGIWQRQALDYINQELNTFNAETKHQFAQTLDWLGQWACARSYGLGSKLPWDPKFLVESLSDSTIYMSYYTVAHHLHRDIFGKEPGLAGARPEQFTDEVWDYIFARRQDVQSDISTEALYAMRREFEYWYPLDVRVSGKDLIQNHLTFFIYIHLALFKKQFWPRAVRVNGHLLLNGEKMSKSTGNFLTLSEAVSKFGADATRIALADSGDGIEDANFEESVANSSILRLYELRKWCEDVFQNFTPVETPEEDTSIYVSDLGKNPDSHQRTGVKVFWDLLFDNELNKLVNETRQHYEGAMFKAALKSGFYDFCAARDFYREATKAAGIGMHRDLVVRFIELQALLLTPLAPHWADHTWREILKKSSTIQNELYPTVAKVDYALDAAREYVRNTSSSITSAESAQQKKLAKGKHVSFDPSQDKRLTIFVARTYPSWQDRYVDLVRQAFDGMNVDMKSLNPKVVKLGETKKAMPFVQSLKKRLEAGEDADVVFERKLPFDELAVLKEMIFILKRTIHKCESILIVSMDEERKTGLVTGGEDRGYHTISLPPVAEAAIPGNPSFLFENIREITLD